MSPPVVVALALPLLLAVVVAGLAVWARLTTGPDTGPLELPARAAPQASSPSCEAVLRALPTGLPGDTGDLAPREIDPPVPGARAWVAEPEPVVLRCGTERPAELGPTSPLIVVNGVSWLPLGTPQGALATTYAVVDRGVYLELSAPTETGPGPLQAVSDAVVDTLPPQPVRVR
ncbi:hypothetical protein Ae406Ps2_2248 [Pseudonocardia sp. Ae406_Ps2]|uniref:DUF3515 domain-containing protein n=1 Tax=unclassified Pseudonocardia TaxID=2619320 RepID=UPI0009611E06|nr:MULTISPECIES: DUF3515 domain-containing protein [unclassified Pseudonocardia]OLM02248.1 hypothetical protein Ae406Ps2_2248 [Pseudonocardia sp. Ae406_Ps2]OLM05969.1 hypothetical protein Ae331Ps2_3679c [Pseudonocardia sp. Ae331_Ps2]OLM23820.1 hypothetical protein Ae706Ps2_2253 [Pseudonocardia sp. Ae706_Ps2]OLM30216.1 hypothetical protein Ae717Ps2_1111c [Pseudonocardia sp. Ae717_Ps2]